MFTKLFISLISLAKFTKYHNSNTAKTFLIFSNTFLLMQNKFSNYSIVVTISESQQFLLFLIEKRTMFELCSISSFIITYRYVTCVVTIPSTNFCYSSSCWNLYRWYFVTIPRPTLYHYSDCFERFVDNDRKSNILNGKSNARGWTTKDLVYFESIDSRILMVVFLSLPRKSFQLWMMKFTIIIDKNTYMYMIVYFVKKKIRQKI